MNNITQGVVTTLIGALIMGAVTYGFMVRENQILIDVLTEKFNDLKTQVKEQNNDALQKVSTNSSELEAIKLMLARTFPKYPFTTSNKVGSLIQNTIPPVEAALVVTASDLVKDFKVSAKSPEDEKAKLELAKVHEQYGKLLSLAKQTNPKIEEELHTIFVSGPNPMGPSNEVEKAHSDTTNILKGNIEAAKNEQGETNKAIRAVTGISVKDIQAHGILGGPNSEVRKVSRDINKIFGL